MPDYRTLSGTKLERLQSGKVFVPSPLALGENMKPLEAYQRLLTLYYIRSGAAAVIPGAHTGEFALHDTDIFKAWLGWVQEMTVTYGKDMILMAAVGGKDFLRQAEIAAGYGYDVVMIAPTAFTGKPESEVIRVVGDIASIIPVFGFELQRAIPGAYTFSAGLWERLFEILCGAKGASFDTYRSLTMLEAAAGSAKSKTLTVLTGNDDRIVADLLGEYPFREKDQRKVIRYHGGLLGHFATDTHAVVDWVNAIFRYRRSGAWDFPLSPAELSHAVNRCNMVLFDALGNFENSVWGVKYRLTRLGLLPGPYCLNESGRPGQAGAIDRVYSEYKILCDDEFLENRLAEMKKDAGILQ